MYLVVHALDVVHRDLRERAAEGFEPVHDEDFAGWTGTTVVDAWWQGSSGSRSHSRVRTWLMAVTSSRGPTGLPPRLTLIYLLEN